MDYTNVSNTEKVKAKIHVSIEKTIDTLTAHEAADLQRADCEALRLLGYKITGLSFFYDNLTETHYPNLDETDPIPM